VQEGEKEAMRRNMWLIRGKWSRIRILGVTHLRCEDLVDIRDQNNVSLWKNSLASGQGGRFEGVDEGLREAV
jgi:hypothetical protein